MFVFYSVLTNFFICNGNITRDWCDRFQLELFNRKSTKRI